MRRGVAHLLLVLVALAGLGAVSAGEARAAQPNFNFCTSVVPYQTLTLGPGIVAVQATSAGINYWSGVCQRFVVDIVVPPNTGAPGFEPYFDVRGDYDGPATGPESGGVPLNQSDCNAYVGYLSVYRKANFLDSQFSFLGGGASHGVWEDGACELDVDQNWLLPSFGPPWFFSVKYRVAVSAKIGQSWKQVKAGASHPPIIT
jgi:hypothetical protein